MKGEEDKMRHNITDKELEKLVKVAEKHIPALEGRGHLEARDSDGADFFETAVWCLKDALIEAYKLGKKAGSK